MKRPMKFHGRAEQAQGLCAVPGCDEPGEFRAPLTPGTFDGPGAYRWLCLDHVRAEGTVLVAQQPLQGGDGGAGPGREVGQALARLLLGRHVPARLLDDPDQPVHFPRGRGRRKGAG